MNFEWHNEKRKIKDLIPYVANPRQITDKQAKDLKASLDKFGIADPIVINTDNTIIGGHQRKKILETLMGVDPDFEIDVRVPDRELTIDESRELNVRLNKNVAEWNFDTLANNFELDDLLDWGFEKSDLDLDLWMPEPEDDPGAQIDRAEELREIWGVETGQLWQLGEHLIYCGNSTKREEVAFLMGDTRASLMVTDPPYGVAYHSNKKGKKSASIEGDLTQAAIPLSFAVAVENVLDDDARLYLFGGTANWPMYSSLFDHYLRMQPRPMIWVKETFVLHPTHYHSQYETVFFGWKGGGGGKDYWFGDRKGSDVWNVSRDANKDRVHPTQKPVEVVEIPIKNSAPFGGLVYEPFSGSGTTLIACERLGRKCRAVEISPAYVAVAIQRWVDMTGGEPVRL